MFSDAKLWDKIFVLEAHGWVRGIRLAIHIQDTGRLLEQS